MPPPSYGCAHVQVCTGQESRPFHVVTDATDIYATDMRIRGLAAAHKAVSQYIR